MVNVLFRVVSILAFFLAIATGTTAQRQPCNATVVRDFQLLNETYVRLEQRIVALTALPGVPDPQRVIQVDYRCYHLMVRITN